MRYRKPRFLPLCLPAGKTVLLFFISAAFLTPIATATAHDTLTISQTAPKCPKSPSDAGFDANCQENNSLRPWLWSAAGAIAVGLSGIFPLLVIPDPKDCPPNSQRATDATARMQLLLSFAVGGLLGDVFLHLLPEAWQRLRLTGEDPHTGHTKLGLLVLAGIFSFAVLEKIISYGTGEFGETEEELENDENESDKKSTANCCNGSLKHVNNNCPKDAKIPEASPKKKVHATGYLNLLANGIDNFTHGLAVAGSFLVSIRMGVLTTAAILIHEVPHEVADFAILMRSGFTRWDAAKAQLWTASVGLSGALTALSVHSVSDWGEYTWWILPYTSGGFLHIALVTVLPELLEEKRPRPMLSQFLCIILGIGVMYGVSMLAI